MTERLHVPKSESLRQLFWRSEILQVMYWLRGEELGEVVTPEMLERFLGVDASILASYLDRLVLDGYVLLQQGGFALSEEGVSEGGEEFEAAFSDITRPAHGECSADCWCHVSAEEAATCQETRSPSQGRND